MKTKIASSDHLDPLPIPHCCRLLTHDCCLSLFCVLAMTGAQLLIYHSNLFLELFDCLFIDLPHDAGSSAFGILE